MIICYEIAGQSLHNELIHIGMMYYAVNMLFILDICVEICLNYVATAVREIVSL